MGIRRDPHGGPLLTEDERPSPMITSPCLVLVITSMSMIMIMLMIQPETCCPILLLRPLVLTPHGVGWTLPIPNRPRAGLPPS
jgi:hypothetical protein